MDPVVFRLQNFLSTAHATSVPNLYTMFQLNCMEYRENNEVFGSVELN